jgi:hypothetical protein
MTGLQRLQVFVSFRGWPYLPHAYIGDPTFNDKNARIVHLCPYFYKKWQKLAWDYQFRNGRAPPSYEQPRLLRKILKGENATQDGKMSFEIWDRERGDRIYCMLADLGKATRKHFKGEVVWGLTEKDKASEEFFSEKQVTDAIVDADVLKPEIEEMLRG